MTNTRRLLYIIFACIVLVTIAVWWQVFDIMSANAEARWAEQMLEWQRVADANFANLTNGE